MCGRRSFFKNYFFLLKIWVVGSRLNNIGILFLGKLWVSIFLGFVI